MRTFVRTEIDAFARARDARQQRLDQGLVGRDEREDRPVVVDVRVYVEHVTGPRERIAKRCNGASVPPL